MRFLLPLGSSSRLSLTAFLAFTLAAQEIPTPPARLAEASLFKNGLAYLMREVEIPGPGTWRVSGLPTPVHGTFWAIPATPGLEIKGARALMESTPTTVPETRLAGLLLLNAGRSLEVKTSEGWITCEVLGGAPSGPDPVGPDARVEGERPAKDHVLLKTEKGLLALPMGDIRALRLPSGNLITHHPGTQSAQVVHLTTTGGKGKVRLWSLARGLAWAPSYQVDITHPKEAVVRGKAVLMNDLENLKAVNVNLIAGFPNLQFAHATDAFTPNLSLNDFMEGLSRSSSTGTSHVLTQQAIFSNSGSFHSEAPQPSSDTAEAATQDLFFHPLSAITLRRGERHYQPMFEHRVPYQHVFVWEIRDTLNDPDRWREGRSSRESAAISREEVWHQLKLKHTGNVPWSTGPALTVEQERILGQDTLHFTPAGGDTLLRITRAMDVTAEQSESEVQRLRDAPTPYSGRWDLVTIKGELQVANHRNAATNMVIKKDLAGELVATSLKPTTKGLPEGLKQVNRNFRLTWEIPIPAKETLKLTYTYKVLVSR